MLFFMNNTEQKAKTVNYGKENEKKGLKLLKISKRLTLSRPEDIW